MPCVIRREGGPEAGYELALSPVPAALAPYIESCVGYREWSPQAIERLELPNGRAVLIFELGPPLAVGPSRLESRRYRGGFYAAIGDEPTLTVFHRVQEGVQVNLTRAAHTPCWGERRASSPEW